MSQIITKWLNDAYAMEKNLVKTLENHADDAKDYPHVRSKILEHLETTKKHAEMVKDRIEELGEDVSRAQSIMAKMGGVIVSKISDMAEDTIIKNALAEYSSEHMEIAVYQSIIAAADKANDEETIKMAEKILNDEMEMAEWLEENLDNLVQDYMAEKEPEAVRV